MVKLGTLSSEGDFNIFVKKSNIPKISLGDRVKILIYLELPKEIGNLEKKRNGTYSGF
jgi:hypothetical protein